MQKFSHHIYVLSCWLVCFTGQTVAASASSLASLPNAEKHTDKFLNYVNQYYEDFNDVLENQTFVGAWVDGQIIYRLESDDRIDFFKLDPKSGVNKLAFNQDAMARQISLIENKGKKVDAKNLPITDLGESDGLLTVRCFGKWYLWINEKLVLHKNESKSSDGDGVSPDKKWRVKYVDSNAVLVDLSDMSERNLTNDGNAEHYYMGADWSPDSQRVLLYKVKPGQGRMVSIIEALPKDQTQPKLHTFHYDKPGDRVDQTTPVIAYIDGRKPMVVKTDILENHFYLSDFNWRNGHELTFIGVERGYGKYHLVLVDTEKRSSKVLIAEESNTYVNSQNISWHALKDSSGNNEIVWSSERDGRQHLYLYDADAGKVKNQITKGKFVVRKIIHVDEAKRRILFTAGGEVSGLDPYYLQYYWVNFDGSGFKRITNPKKHHRLMFSADYRYAVDVSSAPDLAPSYDLINAQTGELIRNIAKCDLAKLTQTAWSAREPFVTKDRDGKFDIWGTIYRPPNFDPNKKYPVIEYIYAGPHGHFVEKDFRFWNVVIDEVAAMGFIVVQIDGKGTNHRSREFSHFSYKNLVDSGFPDRIKWMRAAAKKYPQMDLTRVGIYGGSAGGQSSTAALLHHGEFYKAAVSDCGCHDNRMDKIWWNEQWMDYPVGPHYKEQSNVTNAHKLKGALMLTVGELDKNVDPASTMQLAHALTRAKKKYDLYVVPSAGHSSGEQAHMRSLRAQFFKQHLGGPTAR